MGSRGLSSETPAEAGKAGVSKGRPGRRKETLGPWGSDKSDGDNHSPGTAVPVMLGVVGSIQ